MAITGMYNGPQASNPLLPTGGGTDVNGMFAAHGAQDRAVNPEKYAFMDQFNKMSMPAKQPGLMSSQAEKDAYAQQANAYQQARAYGVQKGYIKEKQRDWLDHTTDYLPYAAMALMSMGAAGAFAPGGALASGGAGAGAAAGGSGLNTAMGGMGGGAMDTAGGGLALTNSGAFMPGSAAAAGGATGGIAGGTAAAGGGGLLAGSIPAMTPEMSAAGMAAGGNAAGVGVGGTGVGATAAGGAALNASSGSSGGWFPNFAEGLGQGAGALSGQNLLNLGVGAGIDALTADRQRNQANSAADKAAGLADPFAGQRPQYQAQLSNLMAHPESINQDPSYQFRLKSGQDALERSNAAKGFLGSGNMNIDLQQYGQQSASQELNNQIGRLTQLSGGNAGPGYAGNVFGSLANTGLANSAQGMSSLGTMGGALVRGLTGTGSTG